MMRLTFCVNMFGKSHERTGVKMATANEVFKAKVDAAIDASISRLKTKYPDAFENTPEELWLLRIMFLDGIDFGLERGKEKLQQL